ncbi:hypothetical protein A2U01_0033026, partial [Trifolium medium]|nr:hypothetical protein [Trifolium medium]
DHPFLFLLEAMVPPTVPLVSKASVEDTVGSVCLLTKTGNIMLVCSIKLEDSEISFGVLDERQTGKFTVNGASIVELLGVDSLSVREAIIT